MEDILRIILSNIDCGSDFKSARLVSRAWLRITQNLHPDGHIRFANHLQTIVEKVLEYNKQFVTDDPLHLFDWHKQIPINMDDLSWNPRITWDFIKKHTDLKWNMNNFVQGPNMLDELVEPLLRSFPCDGDIVDFTSVKISWEYIAKLLDAPYLFDIHYAPVLTLETLQRIGEMNFITDDLMAKFGNEEVILEYDLVHHNTIEDNKYISCEFIIRHCLPNAAYDTIEKNFIDLHKKGLFTFDRDGLEVSVCLSGQFADHKYDCRKLSCNIHQYVGKPCSKCASPEELKKMIDNGTVSWTRVVFNQNLDMESLEPWQREKIDQSVLSRYGSFKNIKYMNDDFTENLNVPIQYAIDHGNSDLFSRRPDLTWDVVMRNFKKINWDYVWENSFTTRRHAGSLVS